MTQIKVPFVNLGLQYLVLREKILDIIDEISKRGNYILGPEVSEFEMNFAKYCETKYAVSLASGTDALFFSLLGLEIGVGDEVITAPNSFIASAWAITHSGARPVFVDVADDFNIDPNLVEKAITSKTKAIMPVHLTGRIAEMDSILEIADKYDLDVIEDAAQAVGATYKGKKAGSFGTTGCFSLHPLKNLHIHGDGGMISTNNEKLHEFLVKFRNHGLKDRDQCEIQGYNSRFDNIQAAIANLKLDYLDEWNSRFRKIATFYSNELKDVLNVPNVGKDEAPIFHRYVVSTLEREALKDYLLNLGVETKINYPIPIHLQEAAKPLGYKVGDFPKVESQANSILSLPIYAELKDDQVAYVADAVNSFFGK